MKIIFFTLALFLYSSFSFSCGGRNILAILIKSNGDIIVDGEKMPLTSIKDYVKNFVANPKNDYSLPEKKEREVPYFGIFSVSKGIVSVQTDRNTTYGFYIAVNNEIEKAYNELRNDLSIAKFKMKYKALPKDKMSAINQVIPKRISEAEPSTRYES